MPTVKEMLSQTSATLTVEGWRAVRIYHVDDLDAGSVQNVSNAAILPEIPDLGDAHPHLDAVVTSKESRPIGSFAAAVTVNYSKPVFGGIGSDPTGTVQRPLLAIGSRVEIVESRRSIQPDGQLGIATRVIYFEQDGIPREGLDNAATQPATVPVFVPRLTITFSRQETVTGTQAIDQAASFIGRTNSGAWLNTRRADLNAADTWLCTGVSANSSDGGLTYVRSYEFTWKPNKWFQVATFIDPATGQPGSFVTEPPTNEDGVRGNGTLVVRIAGQADFNELQLGVNV